RSTSYTASPSRKPRSTADTLASASGICSPLMLARAGIGVRLSAMGFLLGAFGYERQAKREFGPVADLALHLDRARVGLHDLSRRGQTEAGPAGASREERLEYFLQDVGRHALASVDQAQANPRRLDGGGNGQLAAAGHGLFGVQEQVEQ